MTLPLDFLSNPHVKACCKQEENLVEHHESHDVVVRKCKVCGCRHFELAVDPLLLRMRTL